MLENVLDQGYTKRTLRTWDHCPRGVKPNVANGVEDINEGKQSDRY